LLIWHKALSPKTRKELQRRGDAGDADHLVCWSLETKKCKGEGMLEMPNVC